MANAEHVSKLKLGVEAWNTWRQENWNVRPNLSGLELANEPGVKRSSLWDSSAKQINLSGINLAGVDLSSIDFRATNLHDALFTEANLAQAVLRRADLARADCRSANLDSAEFRGANLSDAHLPEANLCQTNLKGAILAGADLESANLEEALLSRSDLRFANLNRANLYKADVRHANLQTANLDHAGVIGIKYDRRSMRGRYQGVRGVDSIFGDAIFRRDVLDQDYIDTLASRWRRSPMLLMLWLWSLIDYGRSLSRVLWLALLCIFVFAMAYDLNPHLVRFSSDHAAWYTPYLASAVTFATFGFSDLVLALNAKGQIIIAAQVILGYFTTAILISVLLQKIARRS